MHGARMTHSFNTECEVAVVGALGVLRGSARICSLAISLATHTSIVLARRCWHWSRGEVLVEVHRVCVGSLLSIHTKLLASAMRCCAHQLY
jgi:hypothetical protein